MGNMQDKLSILPARLRLARDLSGLTLDQIAEGIQCSRQAYQLWETGKNYPELKNLAKVASLFKKPIGWFFGEEAPVGRKALERAFEDLFELNEASAKAMDRVKRELSPEDVYSDAPEGWQDAEEPYLSAPLSLEEAKEVRLRAANGKLYSQLPKGGAPVQQAARKDKR